MHISRRRFLGASLACCAGAVTFTACASETLTTPIIKYKIGGFGPVTWSPDGRRVATLYGGSTIAVWEVPQEKKDEGEEVESRPVFTHEGHKDVIRAMAWSPDGKWVASFSAERLLHVWEATKGDAKTFMFRGRWGSGQVSIVKIAWVPDGSKMAVLCDKEVTIWDAWDLGKMPVQMKSTTDGFLNMYWAPDSVRFVTMELGVIKIWNSGDLARPVEMIQEPYNTLLVSPVWSPDWRKVAMVVPLQKKIEIRTPDLRTRLATLTVERSEDVTGLCWSSDNKHLAMSLSGPGVQVWDTGVDSSSPLMFYNGHKSGGNSVRSTTGVVESLAWSPDGRLVASSGVEGSVHVWDWRAR